MPEIAELLDPTVVEKAKTIAALTAQQPAKVIKGRKGEKDIVVTKASTDPNPPRTLTIADAVTIPPGTKKRVKSECVDCGVRVWLSPKLPDGVDPSIPRVPICGTHAEARAVYAAVVEQRRVETVRRVPVPAPTPNHLARVRGQGRKETTMNLDQVPDAEVGKAVKTTLKAEKTKKVKKNRPKVEAKRAKAEKKARKLRTKDQQQRLVLPGFRVDRGLRVPDLDLTQVTLDEVVHQVDRHNYNAARFRVLAEPALDPETTTWRVLGQEHLRMIPLAKALRKERKRSTPAKKATKKVVAVVDQDEQAKRIADFVASVK